MDCSSTHRRAGSVADCIRDGRYSDAKEAMLMKLAEAFDSTSSARDLKAISLPLLAEIEARAQFEGAEATPLERILRQSRQQEEEWDNQPSGR